MPLAATPHGTLHYDVVDLATPWQPPRLPILFHHGIGASAGIWAGWRPALADAHRLVTFDMRGYGRSTVPSADFDWSLDLLVDDLFAVADAAGLERFHLVGESIGGTVALAARPAMPGSGMETTGQGRLPRAVPRGGLPQRRRRRRRGCPW